MRVSANHAMTVLQTLYNKMDEWDIYTRMNVAPVRGALNAQAERILSPAQRRVMHTEVPAPSRQIRGTEDDEPRGEIFVSENEME